jgi:DNA ligase-4
MLAKDPCRELYNIFAQHIATCQEGLVLKAEKSMYNDYKKPWVKIKRDYLSEAGDQLDLVIVGAAWEKIRARSLRGE